MGNKFLDENGVKFLLEKNANTSGGLTIKALNASDNEIDAREGVNSITPSSLDYAIKVALCDNKGAAWSKTEQLFARIRLGIEEKPAEMQLTEYITNYYAAKKTGKIYQTKIWKFAANPSSEGEKLLDNEGLVFEPSTDTTEGRDDYLNGQNPLFEWMYVNYKRNPDGTPYPTALEGTPNFKTTGDVDIGAMQMEFYWNVEEFDNYFLYTISDSPNETYGLKPWIEGVRADGTILPWCIGSAYYSGIASDGLLHSQPNLPPEPFQSFNSIKTDYPKKGEGYRGAGTERDTFQILFNAIKGATKNSQNLYRGCSNYNFQYQASIKRDTLESYFPVTTAEANNIVIESGVYVGYSSGGNTNRDSETMRAYSSKIVKVLKIDQIDDHNSAIYLDCEPFSTADVVVDGTASPVYISSMPWISGSTNKIIGKHDGSYLNNTDGRTPYRVQGREYQIGANNVSSNTVLEFTGSDATTKVWVAPKDAQITSNLDTIHNNWIMIGTIPFVENNDDYWIGDVSLNIQTGGWYPSAIGSGDTQGTGDMVLRGKQEIWAGIREFIASGILWHNSTAGSTFLNCSAWHGWEKWHTCSAD